MVEVTEFLRRLIKKVHSHKTLSKIQVVFESNGHVILIEDVVRATVYYRHANNRSILTWMPTSIESVRYVVNRLDELRTNKRKGLTSRLTGHRGKVRIQVRKVYV